MAQLKIRNESFTGISPEVYCYVCDH